MICPDSLPFLNFAKAVDVASDEMAIQQAITPQRKFQIHQRAFFRELQDGRYRVSLRSKGKLDVAHVAESFGGGGHECASGCSLEGPLAEAIRQVLFQIGRGPSVQ